MAISINSKERTLDVSQLKDSKSKAALQLIDARVGLYRNDNKITESDLRRAHELLDADNGPFRGLSSFERKLVHDQFPVLEAQMESGQPLTDDAPFATALATSAIIDRRVRACAEAIAKNFGAGVGEVTLTEVNQAKTALRKGTLPRGIDTSVLTAANIEEIELFLQTGKGDLVVHRGVTISGQRFDEAFPLPGEATLDAVTKYEQSFKNSGFDRIYFKGADSRLYIVLTCGPRLSMQPGARVQMGTSQSYMNSGEVVAVQNSNNTLREATLDFWGTIAQDTVTTIRGKLGSKLSDHVEEAGKAASGGGFPVKEALIAGSLAASVGASSFLGLEALAPATGVVVGGLTLFNLIDLLRTAASKDKATIYNAMGVTLNRPGRIR